MAGRLSRRRTRAVGLEQSAHDLALLQKGLGGDDRRMLPRLGSGGLLTPGSVAGPVAEGGRRLPPQAFWVAALALVIAASTLDVAAVGTGFVSAAASLLSLPGTVGASGVMADVGWAIVWARAAATGMLPEAR